MTLPNLSWPSAEQPAAAELGRNLFAALAAGGADCTTARLLAGKAQRTDLLARELPAGTIDALLRFGLARKDAGGVTPLFQAKRVGPHLVFSDLPRSMRKTRLSGDRNTYVDPMWDGPVITNMLVRSKAASGLDMGCGCGIIALAMSTYCKHVTALDMNPRALMLARFNVALNGVGNVEVLYSDLFSTVANRTFDRIVFNAPVGMELAPRNALESGEEILVRFFGQAGKHVAQNGVVQLNLCVKEWENAPLAASLRQWLGGAGGDAFQSLFLELWRIDRGFRFRLRKTLAPFLVHGKQGSLLAMRRGLLYLHLRRGGAGPDLEAATRYDQWAPRLGADFGDRLVRWTMGFEGAVMPQDDAAGAGAEAALRRSVIETITAATAAHGRDAETARQEEKPRRAPAQAVAVGARNVA